MLMMKMLLSPDRLVNDHILLPLWYVSVAVDFFTVCHCQWLVRRMNEVNARQAQLVLRWVTIFGRIYHLGM